MGFLHYRFSAIDCVKCCNLDATGGSDPGSIETIVLLLGWTGILDSKPNFNSTHHLAEKVSEAYSLPAFLEIACAETMEELLPKIATENWVEDVDQV